MTKRDFLLCAGLALCLGGCTCVSPGQNGDIPTCKAKIIRGPDNAIQSADIEQTPCVLKGASGIPAPVMPDGSRIRKEP